MATPASTGASTPVATFPPGPTVEVTSQPDSYRRFASKINPYAIRYPAGWTARGDDFRFGDVRGDVFVKDGTGSQVHVNVLSEQLPTDDAPDARRYLKLTTDQIERNGGVDLHRSGEVGVAGGRGFLIAWSDRSRPKQVAQITQAVWVVNGRGWVATLTTPSGQRSRYLPLFRSMLATLRVRQPS